MSEQPQRRTYRPSFATHVVGTYDRRTWERMDDPDDPSTPRVDLPNPQVIDVRCEACGAAWRATCSTGQVRTHINRFAQIHLHRDPLDAAADPAMETLRPQILERRERVEKGRG